MQKLINYLILNGSKRLSENILLNSLKELQKFSNKNVKKLITLNLIYCLSVFKINTQTNTKQKKSLKKKTFIFVKKNQTRTSLAIKYFIKIIKNEKSICFFKKFLKEILLILKNESVTIETKKDLQKQVFLKKHIFLYFR